MKSKKPNLLRSADERMHNKSAFSFIKSRFFVSSIDNLDQHSTDSLRTSTSAHPKPLNAEINQEPNQRVPESQKPIRSTNKGPIGEVVVRKTDKTRPTSMMCVDSTSQLQSINRITSEELLSRRRNSTNTVLTKNEKEQERRNSLIIVKEGYLYKKSDLKPFHRQAKSDRGWKPYRVVLRGHKLYLYKLATDSLLHAHPSSSPTQPSSPSQASVDTSLSESNFNRDFSSMKPVLSDFDSDTQKLFNSKDSEQLFGVVFAELDSGTKEHRQYVYLLLANDTMFICVRSNSLWSSKVTFPISSLKFRHSSLEEFTISLFYQQAMIGLYSIQRYDLGQAWISTLNSRMYDVTQRYDRSHRFGNRHTTIHALIRQLLTTDDEAFVNTFLLTWPTFTTASNILKELELCLKHVSKIKVVELSMYWCQNFGLDVMGDIATGMINILDTLDHEKANEVKRLVLETANENARKAHNSNLSFPFAFAHAHIEEDQNEVLEEEDIEACQEDGIKRDPINLSNLLITGLTPDLFLSIDTSSFAQQISLFHNAKYEQFKQDMLSPLYFLSRAQVPIQLTNTLVFTSASPHFITKVIRTHILVDSQQEDLFKDRTQTRAQLLDHWIRVGIKLFDLGDMVGWSAIALGTCSIGIVRLRETWKLVDHSLIRIVQDAWAPILLRSGLINQDIGVGFWTKEEVLEYAKVLQIQKTSIPFFGTIRQAVDRYRRHATNTIHTSFIDFEEAKFIHKIITNSLSEWENKQLELKAVGLSDISAVGPLQSYFEYLVGDTMSVPHDCKHLQEWSLVCEPKIFGQGYDQRRLKSNQPPYGIGDSVTTFTVALVFPSILDSCTILNSNCRDTLSRHVKAKKAKHTKSILDSDFFISSQKETKQSLVHAVSDENISDKAKSFSKQRRPFLQRTHSFPPRSNRAVNPLSIEASNKASVSQSLLKQENSQVRLSPKNFSKCHHTFNTRSLSDLHRKESKNQEEILLSVRNDGLVFKTNAVSENVQRDEGVDQDTLLITIKAGRLEQLVDVLLTGISPFESILLEQWYTKSLAEGMHQQKYTKARMDNVEYTGIFFSTYRNFCSPCQLIETLQEWFVNTKNKTNFLEKSKSSSILLGRCAGPTSRSAQGDSEAPSDWKELITVQLRILDVMRYWLEAHPYDFADESQTIRSVDDFLSTVRTSYMEWSLLIREEIELTKNSEPAEVLELFKKCEHSILELYTKFALKIMSPIYSFTNAEVDTKSLQGIESIYRRLTNGKQRYCAILKTTTSKSNPLSFSAQPFLSNAHSLLDTFSSAALLEQIDRNVRRLFNAVTAQEWMQLFDVLDTQACDLYAWLPAKAPSRTSRMEATLAAVIDAPQSHPSNYHIQSEEAVISDIFTAIKGAKRSMASASALVDDDLFLGFPASIQYLYCMHFIVRSWVVREVTSANLNAKTRVMRIEKFLEIIILSKLNNEKLAMFPEGRVPGFVEYAIASALVSPEVRLFSKAWLDVAIRHGHANLSTLESLLNQMTTVTSSLQDSYVSSPPSTKNSLAAPQSQNQWLVPSLGWIFERMLELCFHMPPTYQANQELINFDKSRCASQFLQLIMSLQSATDEHSVEKSKDHMAFVLHPNNSRHSWKDMREIAAQENKRQANNTIPLRGGPRVIVFNKLVNEQMEKLKKHFKGRDKIDKERSNLQQKRQRKQLEQTKQTDRQDRKTKMMFSSAVSIHQSQHTQSSSVMPRINSFFKGLRPHSMISFPSLELKSEFPVYPHSLATKASTVISLIHATTSVAITYTRRNFVFRIVTEDGGQYLLQSADREEMQDWVHHINNVSRQGAAKRQSILAAESVNHSDFVLSNQNQVRSKSNSRTSVFGVPLQAAMKGNAIPLIVDKCIQEIEKRGLEETGIYRVAGTGSIVNALRAAFNKDAARVNLSDSLWADINVVADILKQFLRELPEPLTTYEYYDELIAAAALEDHDERTYTIKTIIKKLPQANYKLLKRVIEHFVIVTDYEATNHMYATNLAIVFAPTLLQPAPSPIAFATTMSNIAYQHTIVKYLISNYHYLFDVEQDDIESFAREDQ